jgi:hypothetical protein
MTSLDENKMKIPFGEMDFLAYVLPGGIMLLSIFVFEFWMFSRLGVEAVHVPVFIAFRETAQFSVFATNWIYSALYILCVLCVAYVSGQLLAVLSAFFFERVLIGKGLGYPFEHLLNVVRPGREHKEHSIAFYCGFFFWFNLYLLLRYVQTFWPSNWYRWALFVSEAVISLAIASKLLRDFAVYKLPKKLNGTSLEKWQPRIDWFRTVVDTFLKHYFALPFRGLVNLLSSYVRLRDPLEARILEQYTDAFAGIFDMSPGEAGSNNYWMSRFFTGHANSRIDIEINRWRWTYKFARNISMAFYISFLYCLMSSQLQSKMIPEDKGYALAVMTGAFLFMWLLALVQYIYLYDNRYSQMVIRAFVFLSKSRKEGVSKKKR